MLLFLRVETVEEVEPGVYVLGMDCISYLLKGYLKDVKPPQKRSDAPGTYIRMMRAPQENAWGLSARFTKRMIKKNVPAIISIPEGVYELPLDCIEVLR